VDVDPVPAGDPPSASAGPGPTVAAGALRRVDAATRMGIRRQPVVRAAIVSGFVVRAMDTAAAVNRGRQGNVDLALIQTLARDLGRDLDRAREYARVCHLKPDLTISPGAALVLAPDQALGRAPGRYALIRYFDAAVDLARELGEAVYSVLGSPLNLRFAFYRGDDLEMARELAEVLGSDLGRVVDPLPFNADHAREQALDLALNRSRALDRVCVQNLAGRLDIAQAEGLADAVLEGAMDDFTNSDLAHASLADADLTGVRWSLSGTIWPPGTDVKALLARSEAVQPGSGVLVFTRRGMTWQPTWQAT
jgi:hypothetical protein